MRSEQSEEIPVADAVEQEQHTAPEPAAPDREDLPLEANDPDWQEQRREATAVDDHDEHPQ